MFYALSLFQTAHVEMFHLQRAQTEIRLSWRALPKRRDEQGNDSGTCHEMRPVPGNISERTGSSLPGRDRSTCGNRGRVVPTHSPGTIASPYSRTISPDSLRQRLLIRLPSTPSLPPGRYRNPTDDPSLPSNHWSHYSNCTSISFLHPRR